MTERSLAVMRLQVGHAVLASAIAARVSLAPMLGRLAMTSAVAGLCTYDYKQPVWPQQWLGYVPKMTNNFVWLFQTGHGHVQVCGTPFVPNIRNGDLCGSWRLF